MVSDIPAKSRFPEFMYLRLPRGTNAALDELASKCHRTKSELVRQAILRKVAQKAHHQRESVRPRMRGVAKVANSSHGRI